MAFSFEEFSKALLITNSTTECIEQNLGPFSLGWHPKYRKQFLICILLNFLNQATGINCLVMYSTNIFRKAGFLKSAETLTTIIGMYNF